MTKRWKEVWKKGAVGLTPWGYVQDVTNMDGVKVAEVSVYESATDNLDMILASPRLLRTVRMMNAALGRYGHTISELFDNDEEMMDAIHEVKKASRLFRGAKDKKV